MNNLDLPIYEIRDHILGALKMDRRVVIQAPTGSGKSTQVPQMLLDAGLLDDREAVVLQPRRLAARMLATRVAWERGGPLGGEVGYQVRFEKAVSPQTRIRYETEGLLLRQMTADPLLTNTAAIIFDEFHERHVYGDIMLSAARELQRTTRPDLLLVVMSATLDTVAVQKFLDPCEVVTSQGRTFPVEIEYFGKGADWKELPPWDKALEGFEHAMARGHEGDALVFMPGAYEIMRTVRALENSAYARGRLVLPLHGEMNSRDQDNAVAAQERPKIIVSTNIAETSLTIPGVTMVVDSGLARVADFDPHRGINTLLIENISQASADQRAGRAGRTAPGYALRLWSERDHAARKKQELPEILRIDLSEVLLTLKSIWPGNVETFPWYQAPDPQSLARSLALLADLGALDSQTESLTGLGIKMSNFPAHPRYARMFMEAGQRGCVRAVALAAALSQGRGIFERTRDKRVVEMRADTLGDETDSDFILQMRAWSFAKNSGFKLDACKRLGIHANAARQVDPVFQQYLRIAKGCAIPIEERAPEDDALKLCILSGFSDQVALRRDSGSMRCDLVHGRRGEVARESVVRDHQLLVATEISEIENSSKELSVLLTQVTGIREDWLREMYPAECVTRTSTAFDTVSRKVVAREQVMFRDLVLRERQLPTDADPEQSAALLANEIIEGRLLLKSWDASVDKWIARLKFLRSVCPDLELPDFNEPEKRLVLEQVCLGADGYKQVKDRDVWPFLKSFLSHAQLDMLDRGAPDRVNLPSGRTAKVHYETGQEPYVASRIQDFFGAKEGFKIAFGRHALTIHLLAPSQRPVQVTRDLASFWVNHYPKIKSELQRKYPKHDWREI